MAKIDPAFGNTGGYFKDPSTGKDLTGKEERTVCAGITEEGKFIHPKVKFADGSDGKLVYSKWTEEEKNVYKQYRAKGKVNKGESKNEKVPEINKDAEHVDTVDDDLQYTDNELQAIIASCDMYHGVMLDDDSVIHDVISITGSDKIYVVDRRKISYEDKVRLDICVK